MVSSHLAVRQQCHQLTHCKYCYCFQTKQSMQCTDWLAGYWWQDILDIKFWQKACTFSVQWSVFGFHGCSFIICTHLIIASKGDFFLLHHDIFFISISDLCLLSILYHCFMEEFVCIIQLLALLWPLYALIFYRHFSLKLIEPWCYVGEQCVQFCFLILSKKTTQSLYYYQDLGKSIGHH